MPFIPATLAASLAKTVNKILFDVTVAIIYPAIPAAFQELATALKLILPMTLLRTIFLLCKCDRLAAHGTIRSLLAHLGSSAGQGTVFVLFTLQFRTAT
jgi:hypothetical protein